MLKPGIEFVVELQGPVTVCTGIPAGLPIIWIQFIEVSALNNGLKGGQLHTVEIRHQRLQAAVMKIPELIIILQGELRGYDRVVNRLLDHNAVLVEEHRLKGQIVCDLRDLLIEEEPLSKVIKDLFRICILSLAMTQRDISRSTSFDRK